MHIHSRAALGYHSLHRGRTSKGWFGLELLHSRSCTSALTYCPLTPGHYPKAEGVPRCRRLGREALVAVRAVAVPQLGAHPVGAFLWGCRARVGRGAVLALADKEPGAVAVPLGSNAENAPHAGM